MVGGTVGASVVGATEVTGTMGGTVVGATVVAGTVGSSVVGAAVVVGTVGVCVVGSTVVVVAEEDSAVVAVVCSIVISGASIAQPHKNKHKANTASAYFTLPTFFPQL